MVLGFGSRSAKKRATDPGPRVVRTSPSLPEMSSQGVAWPSDLVDIASIRQTPPQTPAQGAAKVSFSTSEGNVVIPFHRPFRGSISSKSASNGREAVRSAGTIASLYMSHHPPSAFGGKQPIERSTTPHSARTKHSHSLRKRVAPTFNLMVAGKQGTGKVRSLATKVGCYTLFGLLLISEFIASSSH